jgi:hypothetical protein
VENPPGRESFSPHAWRKNEESVHCIPNIAMHWLPRALKTSSNKSLEFKIVDLDTDEEARNM